MTGAGKTVNTIKRSLGGTARLQLKDRLQERLGGGKPPAEGSPAPGAGGAAQGGGSTADKLRGLLGR